MLKDVKWGHIINCILAFIFIALWGNVLLIKGLNGAISWSLLKLLFAPIGCILLIMSSILLIQGIVRKRNMLVRGINFFLCTALAFPILLLFNVIEVAYPVSMVETNPSITISSPFKETVSIGWGGDNVKDNKPHGIWASERWAYDIVIEPYNINSPKLEDYGIYNVNLYAPVEGTVVATYDGEKDIPPNTEEFLSIEGNYVYILIDKTQTYLLMNHLKENSIEVKVGDHLEVGDYIGKIGNSGSTSEPHLHIHHQKQDPTKVLHPTFAEGLPLFFYNQQGETSMPTAGEELEAIIN